MTETALVLPDETQFKQDMLAINRFQNIVHANMVKGQDYGVIPGTGNKPTLLKPGAEKITKLLGLSDTYEIVDRQENWERGFFRYLIKCSLTHIKSGALVSEGVGECNSMESKYRWRWAWPSELPEGFDKDNAVSKLITKRDGSKARMYRVDNDDVYSQVNTIVKMAKKRSLVDAALSAGRLSNVFTQDIEDMDMRQVEPEETSTEPVKAEPEGPSPSGEKVQNITELKGLLAKHKIATREAYEILSIGSFMELTDLDDAWAKVKEARNINN